MRIEPLLHVQFRSINPADPTKNGLTIARDPVLAYLDYANAQPLTCAVWSCIDDMRKGSGAVMYNGSVGGASQERLGAAVAVMTPAACKRIGTWLRGPEVFNFSNDPDPSDDTDAAE